MGIFSEIDLEQEYQEDILTETPETPQSPAVEPQPPAVEIVPKVEQPETQASTDSQNKTEAAADEDAKRKEHEAFEAKRRAEFDARQAAKKAAMQEKLDRLAAMSDDEVMVASMRQVSADTEKVTRRNMKDCVSEHIQTLCLDDPAFARKVMHPKKSMIRCFQYINQKAWEYVQDELKASGIRPGTGEQGYGCDVPDDLCYQWAVDYFNDPAAEIDQEAEEEFVPRPYSGRTARPKGTTRARPSADMWWFGAAILSPPGARETSWPLRRKPRAAEKSFRSRWSGWMGEKSYPMPGMTSI
ncbi:MAG: hypothetical protein HFF40_03535 [Lawsonibacter sp.]|nr:hypothetical protein [Lawsonibacter sp.]